MLAIMIISIASGKGGTGKTLVAVNLALAARNIKILDCDVEEPNAHLFIKPEIKEVRPVYVLIPKVNEELCNFCGECSKFCEFNAIVVVAKKVIVFPELCHNCGGCILACPRNALIEQRKEVGIVERGFKGDIEFIAGRLIVGEPRPIPVIDEVKKEAENKKDNRDIIIDSPPGTSCPVIASIYGSDYCILVAEPTPFGLYDLKLMVEVVRKMGIKFGVIVNKAGIGGKEIYKYCEKEEIPILLEIPYSRKIAELYSKGIPFIEEMEDWKEKFKSFFESLKEKIKT